LLGYLVLPIDLVPDFIPVLGYADDAIVVVFAVRRVARRAGPEALQAIAPAAPMGSPPCYVSPASRPNDQLGQLGLGLGLVTVGITAAR